MKNQHCNLMNVEKKLKTAQQKKNMLTNDYSKHNQDLISTKHKIDTL